MLEPQARWTVFAVIAVMIVMGLATFLTLAP
jgi:hypothetical protein